MGHIYGFVEEKDSSSVGKATVSVFLNGIKINEYTFSIGVGETKSAAIDTTLIKDAAITRDMADSMYENETTFVEDEDGNWKCTNCNEIWVFLAETPIENKYRYCPNCGKKVVEYICYEALEADCISDSEPEQRRD